MAWGEILITNDQIVFSFNFFLVLYTSVYTCMYLCRCIYIYIWICLHIHMYLYVCVHVYVYVFIILFVCFVESRDHFCVVSSSAGVHCCVHDGDCLYKFVGLYRILSSFFFGVFLNKTNKRPCHYMASTSVLHRCVHDVDCLHEVVSVYRISSSDFVFAYF